METLYDLRNATSLKPITYRLDTTIAPHLFPVPQDNAVGTNDLNNAIKVFTFNRDRFLPKTYFRNAFSSVGGGGQYLSSPISDHTIGFAQTRRFVIYDFKENTFKRYSICSAMDDSILHVDIADAAAKRFFFEIEEQNPESEDWRDVRYSLWLMDLSGDKPQLQKKLKIEEREVWSAFRQQLFVCDFKNLTLRVLTKNMEPSHHPLVDVVQRNQGKLDFVNIVPHPSLPFAVLYGGKDGAQYVCWNQTFRSEEARILFEVYDAAYFSFSPDGRWVVFQKVEPEPKYSFIMPISEKYPNYLGSPILLEGATFDRDTFAWTRNPVNLVGSSVGKLHRYDLTKEGHPEAANYPSYWDYVVEKDLEKLRRDKKQGLGSKP